MAPPRNLYLERLAGGVDSFMPPYVQGENDSPRVYVSVRGSGPMAFSMDAGVGVAPFVAQSRPSDFELWGVVSLGLLVLSLLAGLVCNAVAARFQRLSPFWCGLFTQHDKMIILALSEEENKLAARYGLIIQKNRFCARCFYEENNLTHAIKTEEQRRASVQAALEARQRRLNARGEAGGLSITEASGGEVSHSEHE